MGDALGDTTVSGRVPVGATAEGSDVAGVEGSTGEEGTPPDEATDSTGTEGVVGVAIDEGIPSVEPTLD